jgi:hypothetical protein
VPGAFDTPLLASLLEPARASSGKQVPFPLRLGRLDEFVVLVLAIYLAPLTVGPVGRWTSRPCTVQVAHAI